MDIKQENGFTLIELLTAIAIMSIIFLIFSNTFLSGFNTYQTNQERTDFQQIHRAINLRVAPYVRIAREIDLTPADPVDNDHLMQLYFNERTTGSVKYSGIAYSLDAGNLRYSRYREDPAGSGSFSWGTNISLMSDVSDVEVSYNDNVLTMEVTLEGNRGSEYTFTETFYSRFEDVEVK